MLAQQPRSSISAFGLLVWGLASLFFLYEFFLRTFPGSLAPQIISDLNLTPATFSIVASSYYITYGLMQLPVGILVDKFGVRLIMTFALLACAASTLLFAHSNGLFSAITSRLLVGFGSSFAFVCLLVVALTWFPRKHFGFFAGVSQFIGTMGPLLAGGPLIALMHTYHETWRDALHSMGFSGLILSLLVLLFVRNKQKNTDRALIYLNKNIPIAKSFIALIKNKQVWYVAAYSAMVYISVVLLGVIWGTEYLQARGLPQLNAANAISLLWLGYAIGCPLLGAFSDIARRRKPILNLSALLGFFTTLGIIYLPLHHLYWLYDLFFFLLGIAGGGQNVGFATIAEQVDVNSKAMGLGFNNGMVTLSSAIVPPLIGYFIESSGTINSFDPSHFEKAFSVMPISYLIAFLLSLLFVRETYCKPQKETFHLEIN